MKRPLTESAIRYKLYEAALESGITSDQYHVLMEAGLKGFIQNALASITAGKDMLGSLKKMFSDKKNQALYTQSQDAIQKAVADMFEAGLKTGAKPDELKEFIVKVVEKMAEASAAKAPTAEPGQPGAEGAAPPGTALTPDVTQKNPAAASPAVAELTGNSQDNVAKEMTDKKPGAEAISKVLGAALADKTKMKPDVVTKVVAALMKTGHFILEGGRRRVMGPDARVILAEIRSIQAQDAIVERWLSLAGCDLLTEEIAGGDAEKVVANSDAGRYKQVVDDVRKSVGIEEMSDEDLLKIIKLIDELKSVKVQN